MDSFPQKEFDEDQITVGSAQLNRNYPHDRNDLCERLTKLFTSKSKLQSLYG